MKINLDDGKPIYLQVAEGIEDDILDGYIEEGAQVMSTNQFASVYGINPATAGKGINMLVDEEILFKKRGIGMFVRDGAKEQIKQKRRKLFFNEYVISMLKEAEKLDITKEEIIEMLKEK
ncbi:GntR family transcriptional regulator [Clostridium hydrogenum]|uniref:GntR family transcriptional regulator n=1 Tax=Clostridium hydrogenum TaxID=2855764 RepID=UPI001F1A8796|nr:GntR family transcriptional regulator [Clostridium hydrogenum]